jgi:hypothetical protein
MNEQEGQVRFPAPEHEFHKLGIRYIQVETEDGEHRCYSVEDFCEQLPTASRLAQSYGIWRVTSLLAQQLEHYHVDPNMQYYNQSRLMRTAMRIRRLHCWITALNYCLGEDDYYKLPLPYNVGIVLVSQLTYGVRRKFEFPSFMLDRMKAIPRGVECYIPSRDIPVDSRAFTFMDDRREFQDASISASERRDILRSGLVTLTGANLLYLPVTPYSSNFILRTRRVRVGEQVVGIQYTIPGGHTKDTSVLSGVLESLGFPIYRGKDSLGHTLLDVTYIREAIEETGLPLAVFVTSRPLTVADQIMRTLSGETIRFLAYIGKTIIWGDKLNLLRGADGEGIWEVFGPFERLTLSRPGMLSIGGLGLTPIARIALRIYRE